MAKKVTVTLVDDFDGDGPADETVEFSIDGVSYEMGPPQWPQGVHPRSDSGRNHRRISRGDITPASASGPSYGLPFASRHRLVRTVSLAAKR